MATNPKTGNEHQAEDGCDLCATVHKCMDIALDANLALGLTLLDPADVQDEGLGVVARLHILGSMLDWIFGQALKDVNPDQLMDVLIARNLQHHGIVTVLRNGGVMPQMSERKH